MQEGPSKQTRSVVLITGASGGIGRATACRFAEAGWLVAVHYATNAKGAQETAAACRELGGETVVLQGDLIDRESCEKLAAATLDRTGQLDSLINLAGTTRFVPLTDLGGLEEADFDRIFRTNLYGPYYLSSACAEALRAAPKGSIVNCASSSAFTGQGSSAAYSASKGALVTMTKSLAVALAPSVRVNAVCPDFTDTPWISRRMDAEEHRRFCEKAAEGTLLKRMVQADDVGDANFWLATGAQAITGETILIDCGAALS